MFPRLLDFFRMRLNAPITILLALVSLFSYVYGYRRDRTKDAPCCCPQEDDLDCERQRAFCRESHCLHTTK